MLKNLTNDCRYALRLLRKTPGFTAAVVLTLALGVGANTAMYSVMHAAFFAPYPLTRPDELVRLYTADRSAGGLTQFLFSVPKFRFVRERQTVFSGLEAANYTGLTLLERGEPTQVNAAFVTADFFQTFGATPVAGRFFEQSEEAGTPVAVLGERFWREKFGADVGVVGRGINLSGVQYTVVGVAPRLPPSWEGEVWVPRPFEPRDFEPALVMRGASFLAVVGRLKPGVTEEKARQELALISDGYRADYAANTDAARDIVALSLRADIIGTTRSPLLFLLSAVGLVLLIACANIANLLLVRFAGRRREIALRTALGASRRRIVRQFLIESLLVSLMAGALGVLLAFWGLPFVIRLAQDSIAFSGDIRLNLTVLGATLGVTILTGLLMGAYPAAEASRAEPSSVLREGGRSVAGGRGQRRVRDLLVGGQVTVSLLLLVCAALLAASFQRLQAQQPGFRADNVFVADLTMPLSRYPKPDDRARFYLRLADELRRAPDIVEAALVQGLPLTGNVRMTTYTSVDGSVPLRDRPAGVTCSITPGYFSTMSIPLLAGRDFAERDTSESPQVVIVSLGTARKLFPGADPLGRRIIMGSQNGVGVTMEVVGVVGDVRTQSLAQSPDVHFYRPVTQRPSTFMQVIARAQADPAVAAPTIRQLLQGLDAELPLNKPGQLSDVVEKSVGQQRLLFTLLGLFAALALVLAAIGVYSTVAYTVALRTGEIGVRVALGARPNSILRLVLRQGLRPVLAGLAVGVAGCLALGRLIQTQLYEVSATEPRMLLAACVGLLAVAAVACWLPARRAMRVDPTVALRLG